MKRKAKDLDTSCNVSKNANITKSKIEEATGSEKKKKVKFEKPLNRKLADKNVKKPSIKKDSKGKGLKAVQHKTTSENTDSIDNEKKKKKKIEKSLNKKSTEKSTKKPSLIKKDSKVKSTKAVKHKAITEETDSTSNENKKQVQFDVPSNKNSTDQSVKRSSVKRDAKGKVSKENPKQAKHKTMAEKTDWLKLKKEKKMLKEARKVRKVNDDKLYSLIRQAKQTNEKLRRSDCTQEDRIKLTRTLHNQLKGLYSKIIFTHDMSRVIQCMIKRCEDDTRQAIFCELKSSVVEMSQAKYAKNCLRTLLKYGSQKIKTEVAPLFYGNVIRLMSHNVSAPIVEFVYSTCCKDDDKICFKQEFYGDMYKQAKDKAVKVMADVFKTAEDMKSATLSAVKANLVRILNKGLVQSTLLHTILWEFFCSCSPEDRSELIAMLREVVVALAQTKMGSKVAMQCVWHGNNKDRKIILKAFKENVKSVSTSEHGYMTLLALFDSIDDTVMVRKIILTELQKDLVEIALNEYGRHVILYLVARRDSHYFPPNVVEYLCQGDGNSTSKKAADVREKELLEAIKDPLLQAVTTDAATWLSNSAVAMVTLAILKAGAGGKLNDAFKSIARCISNADWKVGQGDDECSAIEHPGLHMMLKKVILNDKELLKKGESTFGEALVSQLTTEVLGKWIEFNRACFLLILLAENEAKEVVSTLFAKLKPLEKTLKSKKNTGSLILLKKVKQKET